MTRPSMRDRFVPPKLLKKTAKDIHEYARCGSLDQLGKLCLDHFSFIAAGSFRGSLSVSGFAVHLLVELLLPAVAALPGMIVMMPPVTPAADPREQDLAQYQQAQGLPVGE